MILNRPNRLVALSCLIVALAVPRSVGAEDVAPANALPPPATPGEIAAWITELDDNQYLAREEATRLLFEAGRAALDPLMAAANGDRPEPADRAVWILRRFGRSRDNELAVAALERLIQVRGRPALVEKAELELAERSVVACQERLAQLGAEVAMRRPPFDMFTTVPLLHVRLGDKWQGSTEDLRHVSQLRHELHFRLEGAAIDDAAVKLFEEKEKLALLQLFDTKVTPSAVDALKQRHPDAIVYMKNQALLGIGAGNHAAGVLVQEVRPGTAAAAAGIVPGDLIATIDGHALPDFDRLTVRIAQHRPGDTVDVEIVRGEERKKLSVTLGRWPDQG